MIEKRETLSGLSLLRLWFIGCSQGTSKVGDTGGDTGSGHYNSNTDNP